MKLTGDPKDGRPDPTTVEVARLLRDGAIIIEMTNAAMAAQVGFRCTVTLFCADGSTRTFCSDDEDLVEATTRSACVNARLG